MAKENGSRHRHELYSGKAAVTSTQFLGVEPPKAAATPFDYSTLTDEVAKEMRDYASRIQRLQRASVLDVGRELIAAKELVEHGWFRGWVETACQIHIRTAERLMRATLLAQKNDKLSYLPPDGILALASRSAPMGVVNEIIGGIAAGERPKAARIKRQIAQAKQAEKRARESPQKAELQEGQDCEHSQIEAATLIAMLLAWDRFGEFMALLRNADLSIVTQALTNHHDRFAAISGTQGELVLVASPETSPEPEETSPPESLETPAEALAVLDVLTGKTATINCAGTTGQTGPETAVAGTMNDVSAEELISVWGSLKQNTRWYGRQWVSDGCPIARHPQENPAITQSLLRFRAAASKASDTELQRFLDITAPQAA